MTSGVDKEDGEDGTIAVLLEEARDRIPDLLELQERVDKGDTLADIEITDLDDIVERAQGMLHIYDDHPELQDIVARVAFIYLHISSKALENQEQGGIPTEINLGD